MQGDGLTLPFSRYHPILPSPPYVQGYAMVLTGYYILAVTLSREEGCVKLEKCTLEPFRTGICGTPVEA